MPRKKIAIYAWTHTAKSEAESADQFERLAENIRNADEVIRSENLVDPVHGDFDLFVSSEVFGFGQEGHHFVDRGAGPECFPPMDAPALDELFGLIRIGEIRGIVMADIGHLFSPLDRITCRAYMDFLEEHEVRLFDQGGEVSYGTQFGYMPCEVF